MRFWRPTNRVDEVKSNASGIRQPTARQHDNLFTSKGFKCRQLLQRDVPVRAGTTCLLWTAESLSLAADTCDTSDRRTLTSAKTFPGPLHDQLSLSPLRSDWSTARMRDDVEGLDSLSELTQTGVGPAAKVVGGSCTAVVFGGKGHFPGNLLSVVKEPHDSCLCSGNKQRADEKGNMGERCRIPESNIK